MNRTRLFRRRNLYLSILDGHTLKKPTGKLPITFQGLNSIKRWCRRIINVSDFLPIGGEIKRETFRDRDESWEKEVAVEKEEQKKGS